MLDVHKGVGRRAGCVVVKEMTVSSASGVESLVRNNFLWSLAFFWSQKNEDSTLTGHRRLGQLPYLVLSTVHGTGY